MHAFEVRKDDLSVQCVMVLDASVLNDRVGDNLFVLADELTTAAWARLLVRHTPTLRPNRGLVARSARI
jgi:hypothetical protein